MKQIPKIYTDKKIRNDSAISFIRQIRVPIFNKNHFNGFVK